MGLFERRRGARRTPATGARGPGDTVAGRWVLADPIGAGAGGRVWRAWDLREERHVAAKLLRDGTDPALLMRFVREQAVRIAHPHVLAPTGWAADDDGAVLVTELVRGGSLADADRTSRPRRTAWAEAVGVLLLDQALQALVAVHAAGIVHGDVKPANLLLEPTGAGRPHLRLADFGVASTRADGVVFAGSGPVGTPRFWAPELAAGAAPDPAHDVYALGVTGRRLLGSSVPAATLLASMTRPEPHLRPDAAAALARLRALPLSRPAGWPTLGDRLGPDPAPPRRRR